MAQYGKPAQNSGKHRTAVIAGAVAAAGLFALGRRGSLMKAIRENLPEELDNFVASADDRADAALKAQQIWKKREFPEFYSTKDAAAAARRMQQQDEEYAARLGAQTKNAQREARAASHFADFLRGQSIDDYTSMQTLGTVFAQSKIMSSIEWSAKYFKPAQLLDELGGLRLLREAHGKNAPTIQYLGSAKSLSFWHNRIPEGFSENSDAFYAHGKLYVEDENKQFHKIDGSFGLIGRGGAGQPRSFLENSFDEVTGRANDDKYLHDMLYGEGWEEGEPFRGIYGKIARLAESGNLFGVKRTRQEESDLKKMRELQRVANSMRMKIDAIKRQHRFAEYRARLKQGPIAKEEEELWNSLGLDLHANPYGGRGGWKNRARDYFDIGYNTRGRSIWSRDYWSRQHLHEQLENVGYFFNPSEELSVNRAIRSYDVIPTMRLNAESMKNVLMGGTFNGKYNTPNLGTLILHHLFKRVNDSVGHNGLFGWLALSSMSSSSPASLIGNIMMKRALPMYAAGFYAAYLNDEIGQRTGTRPTDAFNENTAKAQLAWAHFKDKHGITEHIRHLDELSNGALGYVAHPFVDHKVGMSEAELADYYAHGEDPIRKGRWWSFGSSTPFRGERVMYWNPNAQRYAQAGNIYQTDTLWGNFNEYYANAALPTPEHPFAPLRHFLFDRYHYEEKHYKDRPYPVSAPLFEPTSFHGAVLNPTLGSILKPTRYYHENDMPFIMHGPHRGERNPHYHGDIRSMNEQTKALAAHREVAGFITPSGQITPMAAFALPGSDRRMASIDDQEEVSDRQDMYARASGITAINEKIKHSRPSSKSGKAQSRGVLRDINEGTKTASRFTPGRILEPMTPPGLFGDNDPNDPRVRRRTISPADLRYEAGLGYYSITEIGGIYGFSAASVMDYPMSQRPILANAGRMTSFERTYWDRWNTGGMLPTPALSEAFRRFLPHDYHTNQKIDPIRNTMPSWLPGVGGQEPGYFLSFLTGDPYSSVPNGEARLPGTAYEHLHGIGPVDLSVGLSQVGYSSAAIKGFITGDHTPFQAWSNIIAQRSNEAQQHEIRSLRARGLLIDSNVDFNNDGVHGSIDAIINQNGEHQIMDIHTLSHKRFTSLGSGDPIYAAQLNYELGSLGMKTGQMMYIDRETGEQKSISVNFNESQYKQTIANISAARSSVMADFHSGKIVHGQLYSDMTKLEILADVAPWSQQYKLYRDYLTHLDDSQLSHEDRERLQVIRHEVSMRKKRFTMTPYKLRYAQVSDEKVTVKDIIDADTFTTLEHPYNPIRLAGVHMYSNDTQAQEWLAQHIHPGARLHIQYATDPTQRIAKDSLHTIRAAVYDSSGQINRTAIRKGYGKEDQESNPAALQVRYTPHELAEAKTIEWLAHLRIPIIHNKFMPVDSPIELYKRTQVYGKDWQDWKHPFKDYLFPSMESFSQQGIPGLLGAGFLGWMLGVGTWKNRVPLVAGAMGIAELLHVWHRKDPIPSYRKKERNIDEYFDILKYIKYEGLYHQSADWIRRHEHKDIDAIANRYEREGEQRLRHIQVLKAEKRDIIVSGRAEAEKGRLREIQHELGTLQGYRAEIALTPEDALALQYRTMAKTTLYGADSHGDLDQIMLAMDPKQREFFQAFLKAPGAERAEILKMVPENERRFLEAAWHMQPENKPTLSEYFKTHNLPAPDWAGWRSDSSLDDYKLVVMKDEGINLTSHGFWPQDEERVAEQGLWDIEPMKPMNRDIQTQLHAALAGMGLRDVDVDIIPNRFGHHVINMHIEHSRKDQNSSLKVA